MAIQELLEKETSIYNRRLIQANQDLDGDYFHIPSPLTSPYAFKQPTKFCENLLSLCTTTIIEQIKAELNPDACADIGSGFVNHDNVKKMLKDYKPQMSIKSLSKSIKMTGMSENSKASAGGSLPTSPMSTS